MIEFNGFPPGDLKFTSVPDLFFARLLPLIEDLNELKVTLHIIWLRQRESKQAVSLAELQTDETLIHGLSRVADDPYEALMLGLEKAVDRGTLLYAKVQDERGEHQLYFLNSEGGRLMLDKIRAGEVGIVAVTGRDLVTPARTRPSNIFDLYQANIGLLSPILADELKDAELTYPQEWIEDAFKIAVENNVRRWSYIRAILEGWEAEGRHNGNGKRPNQKDTAKRWYTDEEYEHLIQH